MLMRLTYWLTSLNTFGTIALGRVFYGWFWHG